MAAAHESEARAAAESAARNAYGRLIAALVRRSGDLAAAEDALADAFSKALQVWPQTGPPKAAEAWLLTTARRRLVDQARKVAVRRNAVPDLIVQLDELAETTEASHWPDDRLRLMLACAHPDLDPGLHTPLMLQAVLGLDAKRIGAAFLVSHSAMGQRLSRGKAKLRDAGAAFETPEPSDLPDRLDAVLSAIYAAFGAGWDALGAEEGPVRGLTDEAAYLAELTAELAQDSSEAHGLAALILHSSARAPARRDADGAFVPLAEQDPALWRGDLIDRAEDRLRAALQAGPPGRFGLEAAIQSVHAERRVAGRTNWRACAALYDALVQVAPSFGAAVARACAHGEAYGAERALEQLSALGPDADRYQPFWAARAHWLAHAGDPGSSREAYGRAAALAGDPAVRRYLERRRDAL